MVATREYIQPRASHMFAANGSDGSAARHFRIRHSALGRSDAIQDTSGGMSASVTLSLDDSTTGHLKAVIGGWMLASRALSK